MEAMQAEAACAHRHCARAGPVETGTDGLLPVSIAQHPSVLHSCFLWELPEGLSLEPKGKGKEEEEEEDVKA